MTDHEDRPDAESHDSATEELLLALREHGVRDRVFDALPDPLLVVDANGTLADLNPSAARLLGRSPDERVELGDIVAAESGTTLRTDGVAEPVTVRAADGTISPATARSIVLPPDPEPLTLVLLTDPEGPIAAASAGVDPVAAGNSAVTRDAEHERRSDRLQALTDTALAHLSLDQLLTELLDGLRDVLGAETATVLQLDPQDRVLRIRATSGLERPDADELEVPLGVGIAGRIALGARPVIIGDVRRARPVSPFLHNTVRSLVGVPIVHRGNVTGVLHVGSTRTRRFTEDDIALLESVAARLAPAIVNAELHELERAARAAAEADAARLRLVQELAEALGTIHPVEEMASVAIERIAPALDASAAVISLVADRGVTLDVVASVGYERSTLDRWRSIPMDARVPLVSCVLERRPILLGSREERDNAYPSLAGTLAVGESWAALPLVVDARAIGAIGLSFPGARAFGEADVELLSALANQCAQALDRARRSEAERRSLKRAEETSARLALLQSLTARFSRALTPREVAAATVSEISASLDAAAGAFMVLESDGMLELLAAQGYDERALSAWQRFPADAPTPAGDALRSRDLVVVSPAELADRYPHVASSSSARLTGSTVAFPVHVDRRPIGAVAFTLAPDRQVTDADRTLLRALGRHAGQALERARLYENERIARRDAERARERTERLQALAAELSDADTPEHVAVVLSEHILAALGGNASAVMRVREGDRVEVVASRGYLPETLEPYRTVHLDAPLPMSEVIRTRVGVWIGSREEFAARYPDLLSLWDRTGREGAFAAIPLKVADRVLGSVGVQFPEPRVWNDEDRELLRAIARQSAQAIEQVELRGAGASTRADLERSERRFRSLVETTTAIHWAADPAGAFVEPQASWEAFTGQRWDEHRGFGWVDAVHPDDRASLMRRWVAARDAGSAYVSDARLFHAPSREHRHVVVRAAPVRDGDGRIGEWVGTVSDRHDLRRSELAREEREAAARNELEMAGERLAYLAAASTVLAASLDMDQTLQRLAELAVPRLADWCTIDLVDPGGNATLVAVAHVDPKKVELAYDLRRRYPPDPEDETGVPMVLRTGRSFLLPEIPEEMLELAVRRAPELRDLVEELHLRSVMVVPISVGDRVLGAMSFVWAESGQIYDTHDLALAEDLAHRAAVAIENARLYEAERAARREEAIARERFQLIAETSATMAEVTPDARRIVESLARMTTRRLSDVSIVYLVGATGSIEEFVAAHRDPSLEHVVRRAISLRFPTAEDEHGTVAQVLRTGERVLVERLSERELREAPNTDEQRTALERLRPTSELAVPLQARGRLLGVLSMLRSDAMPPFDEDDLQLATDLARRAGLMLDNARLYAEREEIAETLQRSLLPPDLPTVPGLDVGARYLPAAEGLTVGGDFYDVFEIDLDHWGVVIGDVVGKGAPAAAMMGLARYTVRTAAMSESRPSALLRTLNDAIVRQTRESMFCTACFARMRRDADGIRVTLAVGGHPLPMMVRPDGSVEPVGDPGTLLGIFEDPTISDRVVDLHPGEALVLYTDGVTDERRGDEDFGETRLRHTLAGLAGSDAQAIADGVVDAVVAFRSGQAHDDIAILVIRVRPGGTA